MSNLPIVTLIRTVHRKENQILIGFQIELFPNIQNTTQLPKKRALLNNYYDDLKEFLYSKTS